MSRGYFRPPDWCANQAALRSGPCFAGARGEPCGGDCRLGTGLVHRGSGCRSILYSVALPRGSLGSAGFMHGPAVAEMAGSASAVAPDLATTEAGAAPRLQALE